MKFKTLHYIPRIDGHFLDDGIGIWTFLVNFIRWPKKIKLLIQSYCSHVEIWTPDAKDGFEKYSIKKGKCWTSTMRGKENGVVCRDVKEVLTHPERWICMEWETDEERYGNGINWMTDKVITNQGYGKQTIRSFFWMRRTAKVVYVNGKKVIQYICSSFCDNAFDILKEKSPYAIPSPLRWTLWLLENRERLGGKFVKL